MYVVLLSMQRVALEIQLSGRELAGPSGLDEAFESEPGVHDYRCHRWVLIVVRVVGPW